MTVASIGFQYRGKSFISSGVSRMPYETIILAVCIIVTLLLAVEVATSRKDEPKKVITRPRARPHVPPPKIVERRWFFVGRDGQSYGPVLQSDLAKMFRTGECDAATLLLP